MTALRTLAATLAAAALLAGCTDGPGPEPDAADPSAGPTAGHRDGPDVELPAVVTAGEGRSLTGCGKSVGWVDVDEQGHLAGVGVVASAAPADVIRLRPAGPRGANTRTEYRLLLSTDGAAAAVTSVETVRGNATTPDRYRSVVQVVDLDTGAETSRTTVPGIVFPYGQCYTGVVVLSPRRAFPVPTSQHRAHVVDTRSGTVARTVALRPDENDEDHVTAVTATTLVVNRFDRRADAFATEGISLHSGRRLWFRPARNASEVAVPVLGYDPRHRRLVVAQGPGTAVLDSGTGKLIAAVRGPRPGAGGVGTWAIDPFTATAYLTDGSNLAAVGLKTGKVRTLGWAKNLHRVGFDLRSALAGRLVAETKGELRSLVAATGADQGLAAGEVSTGGENWAGTVEDGALVAVVVYDGPMDPRIRVAADTVLAE